jgi:hypothetical protein
MTVLELTAGAVAKIRMLPRINGGGNVKWHELVAVYKRMQGGVAVRYDRVFEL